MTTTKTTANKKPEIVFRVAQIYGLQCKESKPFTKANPCTTKLNQDFNGTVNLSFTAPRSNHKFSFWLPGVSFKESSDNWKITGKSR